jgi:pyruvate/2-oxoglutarate/acetoin dehydrogenase E1 component
MTIRTTVGSSRFGAQHAQSLEAWFMHTPGINVVFPSTPADARGLLLSAIFGDDPTLFIEHSELLFTAKGPVPDGDVRIPFGVAETRRAGDDVTVIAYGPQVGHALSAADALALEGIRAEVIDLRTLVPLDRNSILASVSRTGRAVVTHDATRTAGVGAEIASLITEELFGDLQAPVARLGGAFVPVPFSTALHSFPTTEHIIDAVRQVCGLAADGPR